MVFKRNIFNRFFIDIFQILKIFIFRSKPIIVIRLKGGLGNQLFIYAIGKKLSIKFDTKLLIDNYTGFAKDKKYKRISQLQNLKVVRNDNVIFLPKFISLILYLENKFQAINLLNFKSIRNFSDLRNCIFEKDIIYRPLYLDYYSQYYSYFNDIREILIKEIKPSYFSEDVLKISDQIYNSKKSCAVQIRVFEPNPDIDKLNAISNYISKACLELDDYENITYYIFSESIYSKDIINNSLLKKFDKFFVTNNHKQECIGDMYLMSCCQNFIITNSTFGWWGAWISPLDNKKVICPASLDRKDAIFGGSWDSEKIAPDNWIKMKLF